MFVPRFRSRCLAEPWGLLSALSRSYLLSFVSSASTSLTTLLLAKVRTESCSLLAGPTEPSFAGCNKMSSVHEYLHQPRYCPAFGLLETTTSHNPASPLTTSVISLPPSSPSSPSSSSLSSSLSTSPQPASLSCSSTPKPCFSPSSPFLPSPTRPPLALPSEVVAQGEFALFKAGSVLCELLLQDEEECYEIEPFVVDGGYEGDEEGAATLREELRAAKRLSRRRERRPTPPFSSPSPSTSAHSQYFSRSSDFIIDSVFPSRSRPQRPMVYAPRRPCTCSGGFDEDSTTTEEEEEET